MWKSGCDLDLSWNLVFSGQAVEHEGESELKQVQEYYVCNRSFSPPMQILSVVLRAPRFRPTLGKSWFSWRERPNHLCMSQMRVRSLLLDIPPLRSPFPSHQMQNFLLMQLFEKNT